MLFTLPGHRIAHVCFLVAMASVSEFRKSIDSVEASLKSSNMSGPVKSLLLKEVSIYRVLLKGLQTVPLWLIETGLKELGSVCSVLKGEVDNLIIGQIVISMTGLVTSIRLVANEGNEGVEDEVFDECDRLDDIVAYGMGVSALALVSEAESLCVYRNGVSADFHKALNLFESAAGMGDATAMFRIGEFYHEGKGISFDYGKAMEWYQKAVDNGNTDGMVKIGHLYYYGYGVSEDYRKAMEWYQKAVDNGNTDGMVKIGNLYYDGHGVSKDYRKAMEWYQKAVDNGNTDGMVKIGDLYYQMAMEYHRIIAKQWNGIRKQLIMGIQMVW